jgi:hypothetical protein
LGRRMLGMEVRARRRRARNKRNGSGRAAGSVGSSGPWGTVAMHGYARRGNRRARARAHRKRRLGCTVRRCDVAHRVDRALAFAISEFAIRNFASPVSARYAPAECRCQVRCVVPAQNVESGALPRANTLTRHAPPLGSLAPASAAPAEASVGNPEPASHARDPNPAARGGELVR